MSLLLTRKMPNIFGPTVLLMTSILLEGNESGRAGSTNSWASMPHWLVRDGELSQVVGNHLRLDLNLERKRVGKISDGKPSPRMKLT